MIGQVFDPWNIVSVTDDEEGIVHGIQRQVGYEDLMERMMSRPGLNLSHRCKYPGLRHRTMERMMSHCAACGASEDCQSLLAQNKGAMREPPAYRHIRKLLMKLGSQRGNTTADPVSRPAPGSGPVS